MGAENVLELVRLGRLSPREGAAYEVVHQSRHYKLRHYRRRGGEGKAPAILLVPPLMLTAEIYDVAPDISAVRAMTENNADVWVVDFGAPEREEGGMGRTLDDHVRSVADAIGRVRDASGRDVHLAGYSQGGMFAYQAAAYRRSEGLASVITFGSPVDIHRSLPNVSTDLTARLIRAWRPIVEPALARLEGLPGVLTSTGFKVLSLRKEVQQLLEFLTLLHDRRALQKRESRRRFLGGEGFVAWPGPALMKFIDEFVVHNRLMSGGFVIDGRTVTLADIRCPVLYFVGGRDDIARPSSVRAVRKAIPSAELFEVTLPAGHFGLVVGSTAMQKSWPAVIEWLDWQERGGSAPELFRRAGAGPEESAGADRVVEVEDAAFEEDLDIDLFYDVALRTVDSTWKWLGDTFEDAGDTVDQLRYQLPRLLRLRRIRDDTLISMGRVLSEQASTIGDRTYFLYEGRAVTYADANRRVDAVVKGLIRSGIRPGNHVGVLMRPRPSFLSIVCALNRLGAIAVVVRPDPNAARLERAVGLGRIQYLVADPENAKLGREAFNGRVLVLGGAGKKRSLPEGVTDMEAIDPDRVELPAWYQADPGRAEDLALVLVTVADDRTRAARITNRRWAFSALGAAAACTLSPNDTVYCCLPLHHPAGLLVSAGGASVGGARLALASRFEPDVFWDEVRRYGATVAFYAGEMCRALTDAPNRPGERTHPLRLFAGSGMRADVWQRLVDRFDVGVLEFYASTEVSLVLANAGGKVGALGRPLPGSREALLGAFDLERQRFVRNRRGRVVEAALDQPGILLGKIDPAPRSPLDEAEDEAGSGAPRVLHGVLDEDDSWFATWDLMRRDDSGDYWFIDRLKDLIRTEGGLVSGRLVEGALYTLDGVRLAAVYGMPSPKGPSELIVAAVALRPGVELDAERLSNALGASDSIALPAFVRVVDDIEMTDGFRPMKAPLEQQGLAAKKLFRYEPETGRYIERTAPRAATA